MICHELVLTVGTLVRTRQSNLPSIASKFCRSVQKVGRFEENCVYGIATKMEKTSSIAANVLFKYPSLVTRDSAEVTILETFGAVTGTSYVRNGKMDLLIHQVTRTSAQS